MHLLWLVVLPMQDGFSLGDEERCERTGMPNPKRLICRWWDLQVPDEVARYRHGDGSKNKGPKVVK